MIGRLVALGAAVAAAAGAGAAVWAKRKAGTDLEAAKAKPGRPSSPQTRQQPVTTAAPATAPHEHDDPTSLKGIGAVSSERLAEAGVTTIAQIAAWTDDDIDAIAAHIKVSPERIRREDWAGQARSALEVKP